jgi:hypothetical protein
MAQGSKGSIFISYSRKDNDVLRRIVLFLRKRGIKAWVDNEKLTPGTSIWEEEIEKAIIGASAIIVVLSPDSKNSEWVRREISLAEQNRKKIFPVLVRGDRDSSITLRLINHQFVDIRENEAAGLTALYTSLNQYLRELQVELDLKARGRAEEEPEADKKAAPSHPEYAKEAAFAAGTLTGRQTMIPQRVLYVGLPVMLLIGLAWLGMYALRNMGLETTPTPLETKEQTVVINPPLQVTLSATNTIPVAQPSPTMTITPSPVSTSTPESPTSIPVNGTSVSITASRAYLYKGPHLGFGLAVQIAYPRDQRVALLARTPSALWFLCKTSDGNQGWLYHDWLDLNFDPLVIPTASFIPALPGTATRKPNDSNQPTATCVIC